jgi:hypothetical protein
MHNKKLQNSFNQLKKDYSETSFTKLEIDEMLAKIKFYQDENIRLSSELVTVQKKNENIKVNLTDIEIEKDEISSKIKELSKSIEEKTNLVSTNFVKDNSQSVGEKLNFKEQKNLDEVINKIFSKI